MAHMMLNLDNIFPDFKAKLEKQFGQLTKNDWDKMEDVLNDLLTENDANEKAVIK